MVKCEKISFKCNILPLSRLIFNERFLKYTDCKLCPDDEKHCEKHYEKMPAIIKSNKFQLTSSVNCIAIIGMSSKIAAVAYKVPQIKEVAKCDLGKVKRSLLYAVI